MPRDMTSSGMVLKEYMSRHLDNRIWNTALSPSSRIRTFITEEPSLGATYEDVPVKVIITQVM